MFYSPGIPALVKGSFMASFLSMLRFFYATIKLYLYLAFDQTSLSKPIVVFGYGFMRVEWL